MYGDKNHQKLSEIMLVLRTLVDAVHQGFFFVARRLLNVHRVGRCARMDMSQTSVADLLGSANSVSQILTWSAYRCILTFHQIHIDSLSPLMPPRDDVAGFPQINYHSDDLGCAFLPRQGAATDPLSHGRTVAFTKSSKSAK